MTNEQKFLGYLEDLKGSQNQKLIECVQEGFKTLVEYQVVGNMSERGVDLMEGNLSQEVPENVVQLIEKLTEEIEELRDAMQSIDDIADEYDKEGYDTAEDLETEESGDLEEDSEEDSEEVSKEDSEEEREPVEESYVRSTDGVEIATSAEGLPKNDRAYERAASSEESGGSLDEREPNRVPDVDPRDIDPIEIGQRKAKVEYGRAPVDESGCGRDSMNEFGGAAMGIIGKLAAQYIAGAAIEKLVDNIAGDSEASEKEEIKKEIEDAATKMRESQTEGLDLPENIREGEAAGNDAVENEEHEDHEGKMANKQLSQIHDQSGKLSGAFEDDEELKAWMQAKLTKAQQTIDAIYEFFREEKNLDEKPEGDEEVEDDMDAAAVADESPIFEK